MHETKQNEIIDLTQQLELAGSAMKTIREQHESEKQLFVQSFKKFRADVEVELHELQEYFIQELIRVFDFSDAEEIKEHVKDLIQKSEDSALITQRLRDNYERQYDISQRYALELQDLKQQISQLKSINFEKEQLITDLQINSGGGLRSNASIMAESVTNESSTFTFNTLSRTSSESSLTESISPESQPYLSTHGKSEVFSPQSSPKEFRRSNASSSTRETGIVCDTKQVGDEFDYRAIVLRVREDVNEYKLTRNPTVSEPSCELNEIPPLDTPVGELFKKFKVSFDGEYNENRYISLVMPWIADVESSKQLLMKQHAALLERYNTVVAENNKLASENSVHRGNICLLQTAFDKASIEVKEEQDKAAQATADFMRRIDELNLKSDVSEQREKTASESQRENESRCYQLEEEVEALSEELEELQKQVGKELRPETKVIDENKLERKIISLQELIEIYQRQISTLCNRAKDLEYENQDLQYEFDNEEQQFKRELESLSQSEHSSQAEGKVRFYEEKLEYVSAELFEQVQELDRRNCQYDVLERENSQQAETIVQISTEKKLLKRKITELTSKVSGLLLDFQERNFAATQVLKREESQINAKNAEIEQLSKELGELDIEKLKFPPQMPKNPEIAQKDAMNRVISREPRVEMPESEVTPQELQEDIEIEQFRSKMQSDAELSDVKNVISTLQANITFEAHELRNTAVETEQCTETVTYRNEYCQAQVESSDKSSLTPLYINENDPALTHARKEIDFLEEQVNIYEQTKIMQEARNQIYVNTYEEYQSRVAQLENLAKMHAEDQRSGQLRFERLLREFKAFPTVEQLRTEASRDFLRQIGDLEQEITTLEESLASRNAELESERQATTERFKLLIEEAFEVKEQIGMLDWYAKEYNEKIDRVSGSLAYQIEKITAVMPPLLDYVKQLKGLLVILKGEISSVVKDSAEQENGNSGVVCAPLTDLLAKIGDFEENTYNILDTTQILSQIKPNRRSTSFAKAQADDLLRVNAKIEEFHVPSIPGAEKALVSWDSVKGDDEPSRRFARRGLPALQRAQTDVQIDVRPFSEESGVQHVPECVSRGAEVEFSEKEFILTSALYIDAFNQLEETIQANLLQADQIKSLNITLRRQQEQHDSHVKDVKFQFNQRPPRDVDASIIQQQKISIKVLENELSDYKRRYDAIVAQLRNADGIVNLMIGGRSNSAGNARREKWNLNAGTAYANSLRKYV